jgi:hypothetical protein
VLVVVGILIALYINNWNQDRILESEIEKYLVRLNAEYEYNVKRAEYLLKEDNYHAYYDQYQLVDSVRNVFLSGINRDNYKLVLTKDLFWYNQFRIKRDVYDQGIGSGILFQLDNSDLLDKIQRHDALMEGRQKWVDKRLVYFNSSEEKATKFKFIRSWVSETNEQVYEARSDSIIENHPWLFDQTSDEYELAFLSVDMFKYFLNARIGYLESEIEGSSELISSINNELKK